MCHLVKYNEISENEYLEYITEWEKDGNEIVPGRSARKGLSFSNLQRKWAEDELDTAYKKGIVPAILYFYIDENRKIIGAIHFRHDLFDELRMRGGHIGYGIRSSERNKGYAKSMLKELLNNLDNKKYEKVLLTCEKDNIQSYRTIEA